jgi:hypothetical protein
LKEVALRGHATVPEDTETVNPLTVQLLKSIDVTVPIPDPRRPLPDLRVPLSLDVTQLRVRPEVVSVSWVVPAFPLIAPPGFTVQVVPAGWAATATPTVRTPINVTAVKVNPAI